MLMSGENHDTELYQKSDLPPVDHEVTIEQVLILAGN